MGAGGNRSSDRYGGRCRFRLGSGFVLAPWGPAPALWLRLFRSRGLLIILLGFASRLRSRFHRLGFFGWSALRATCLLSFGLLRSRHLILILSFSSLTSSFFLGRAAASPVQVDTETDAGTPEIHHVPIKIRELEPKVSQGDGASDVDQVIVVCAGLHDVAHPLAANDLGNDVVAQGPHTVCGIGQRDYLVSLAPLAFALAFQRLDTGLQVLHHAPKRAHHQTVVDAVHTVLVLLGQLGPQRAGLAHVLRHEAHALRLPIQIRAVVCLHIHAVEDFLQLRQVVLDAVVGNQEPVGLDDHGAHEVAHLVQKPNRLAHGLEGDLCTGGVGAQLEVGAAAIEDAQHGLAGGGVPVVHAELHVARATLGHLGEGTDLLHALAPADEGEERRGADDAVVRSDGALGPQRALQLGPLSPASHGQKVVGGPGPHRRGAQLRVEFYRAAGHDAGDVQAPGDRGPELMQTQTCVVTVVTPSNDHCERSAVLQAAPMPPSSPLQPSA